ncbi:MAG: folate family ECF transporter S component [Armatimonadota bacterium]
MSVKLLVNLSLFIALAIVFRRLLSISVPPVGNINFGGFPIILSGFLFGPLWGGVVGGLSDILGYPLFPRAAYHVYFTLTSVLTGILPALIYSFFRQDKNKPSFLLITVSIFIGQFITSVYMVSYFMSQLFGYPFVMSFFHRAVSLLIRAPLYAFLSIYVIKVYNRINE